MENAQHHARNLGTLLKRQNPEYRSNTLLIFNSSNVDMKNGAAKQSYPEAVMLD